MFTTGAGHGVGIGAVFAGMIFGILAFVGFDAAAPIAEEAREPRKTIPRALVWSVVITGVFFTFCFYAATVYWGPSGSPPCRRSRPGWARESSGFSAGPRRRLQEAIDALQGAKTTADAHAVTDPVKNIAELEAQAAELEVKARDLRGRIAELKRSQTSAPAPTAPKGAAPSD